MINEIVLHSNIFCSKSPRLICILHNFPREHSIQHFLSLGVVLKIMLSYNPSFWNTHSTIFILAFADMYVSQRYYFFFASFLMQYLLFTCIANKFCQLSFIVWNFSTKCSQSDDVTSLLTITDGGLLQVLPNCPFNDLIKIMSSKFWRND